MTDRQAPEADSADKSKRSQPASSAANTPSQGGAFPGYGGGLSGRQRRLLYIQQTQGNSAARRMLAKDPSLGLTNPKSTARRNPLQRDENNPAPATDADVPKSALIVDDDSADLKAGQLRKTQFLQQLEEAVCATAQQALADTAWSVVGCPWIAHWFGYYKERTADQIERSMYKFTPETRQATSAADCIPLICTRVQAGIQVWATTGQVTGVPEDIPEGMLPPANASPESPAAAAEPNAETIQRKPQYSDPEADEAQSIQARLGGGRQLDDSFRTQIEPALGADFSRVRVHTDTQASTMSSRLNARAFTVGEDIAFSAGEYKPGTLVGSALIAHELAHVMQQSGSNAPTVQQKGATPYDALEVDADRSAINAVIALSGRAKGALTVMAREAMPRLKSGLRLQRCNIDTDIVKSLDTQATEDLKKQPENILAEQESYEEQALAIRQQAAEYKLFPAALFTAWTSAQSAVLKAQHAVRTGGNDATFRPTLSQSLGDFYRTFRTIIAMFDRNEERTYSTGGKFSHKEKYTVTVNKYGLTQGVMEAALQKMQAAKASTDWLAVFADFRQISAGMDEYVADKLREKAKQDQTTDLTSTGSQAQSAVDAVSAAIKGGKADPDTHRKAADALKKYYEHFTTAIAPLSETRHVSPKKGQLSGYDYLYNPYSPDTTALDRYLKAVDAGTGAESVWPDVVSEFQKNSEQMKKFLADPKRQPVSMEAETLLYKGAAGRSLDALLEEHPNAKKVQAIFYPRDEAETAHDKDLATKGIPMLWYLYNEDKEWTLVDMTRRNNVKKKTASGDSATEPPIKDLFKQLDSRHLFPKGLLEWRMPDTGQQWHLETTEPYKKLMEFLETFGLAAAAVGIALTTLGTGTVLEVYGAYAIGASAAAGGIAAAVDFGDRLATGELDVKSAIIDVAQFISAVSGLGLTAAGRLRVVARTAAAESKPLSAAAAKIVGWADAAVVPLAVADTAAQTVNLAVILPQFIGQYDAIDNDKSLDDHERQRQKSLLLHQIAFNAGLGVLAIKGNIAEMTFGRAIHIEIRDGVAYAMPEGMSAAGKQVASKRAALEQTAANKELVGKKLEAADVEPYLNEIRTKIGGEGGEALAQVEQFKLSSSSGEGVFTVDAQGQLKQGTTATGTVEDMVKRVNLANNANRAHGIEIEYILEMRPGATPGSKELHLQSREATPRSYAEALNLYTGVGGRTADVSSAMGRLTKLEPHSTITMTPEGMLQINKQVSIHPDKLKTIVDADLKTILEQTRVLGDARANASTRNAAQNALKPLASKYYIKFEFQRQEADALLKKYGLDQLDIFKNLSAQQRDRILQGVVRDAGPKAKLDTADLAQVQSQAIDYAKNHVPPPDSAEEFVSYYQAYIAEFNTARDARLTAGADKKAITQKLVEEWGAPNNPRQVGQTGLKAVGDDMKGIEGYWSSHITENLLPLPTGVTVREVPPQQIVESVTKMAQDGKITFGNQAEATYHTVKHFSEIPDGHIVKGSDGNPLKAQSYHQSALTTIKTSGARDAASIAAGAQEGQYGGGRTFYFKDGEITAFVLVTDNRRVILLTYFKKE